MRLFAAIEIPAGVVDEIAAWWQGACLHLPASAWRDIPRQNWHVTLAFYGDVSGGCVADMEEGLAECAAAVAPVRLCLTHAGLFPNLARARVFWLGIADADGSGRLKSLAHCCRRAAHATVRKHSSRESRFRGHVTLARMRGNGRGFPALLTAEMLAEMPRPPEAEWTAATVALFESELHRDGARYRILEEYELSGRDR